MTTNLSAPVAALVERDDSFYEVVRGKIVELVPLNVRANILKSCRNMFLGGFVDDNRRGWIILQTIFVLDEAALLLRRPHIAFVSYDRWPRARELTDENAWDVIPDLAVEIIGPTDRGEDVLEKIREYFFAGVRLVWAVYPRLREIHIFDGSDLIRVVRGEGTLDGGEVIPGFRLPLATLFEDRAED